MIKCCKDCQNRVVGCHSNCEQYNLEKKELDILNKKTQKAREEYKLVKKWDYNRKQ